MANFKFQKSALAISSMAALVALLAPQAQAANDVGELDITGQISAATCLLSLGDATATNNNSKTLNLGTFTTAQVIGAAGTALGSPQTAILSVKAAADGASACALGGAKWDVGINIASTNYETIGGATVLKNTASTGAAKGFSVKLSTSTGTAVTAGSTAVNFASVNNTYGTLLSGSTVSGPTLSATDVIALTAQMISNTFVVIPGVFSHSIPLNLWYK